MAVRFGDLSSVMDVIHSIDRGGPFPSIEGMIGDARVIIGINTFGTDLVEIFELEALAPMAGAEALRTITETADELGWTLALTAQPFEDFSGMKTVHRMRLVNFYKRFGFEFPELHLRRYEGIREPR